jgi:hypothetical protein
MDFFLLTDRSYVSCIRHRAVEGRIGRQEQRLRFPVAVSTAL